MCSAGQQEVEWRHTGEMVPDRNWTSSLIGSDRFDKVTKGTKISAGKTITTIQHISPKSLWQNIHLLHLPNNKQTNLWDPRIPHTEDCLVLCGAKMAPKPCTAVVLRIPPRLWGGRHHLPGSWSHCHGERNRLFVHLAGEEGTQSK